MNIYSDQGVALSDLIYRMRSLKACTRDSADEDIHRLKVRRTEVVKPGRIRKNANNREWYWRQKLNKN